MAASQPGAGDPYWYEWFVGIDKVIDLLLPETNLESVTFQHPDLEGIDDIVVKFNDGTPPCCYQVKHTRSEKGGSGSLTFGSLVEKDGNGKSLIGALASGWKTFLKTQGIAPTVVLYSNRRAGENTRTAIFEGEQYRRKPLNDFIELLDTLFARQSSKRYPTFPNRDEDTQFRQLIDAMGLEKADDSIGFLKSFKLDLSKPSLSDAKDDLIRRLKTKVCGNQDSLASSVFRALCSELYHWTTSGVGNIVTKVVALECIAQVNEDKISRPVVVPVPHPVFPSREELSEKLAQRIVDSEKRVLFVTGVAGSGKTRLVSCVYEVLGAMVKAFRFHAFKPLDIDDFSYSPDRGIVDAKSMWSTFVNQLRRQVNGPYDGITIPVINDLCTGDELRSEAMRLAELLSAQSGTETILIVDGIDHAARADNQLTFLGHLPAPDKIPEGVKFVLVGQPKEGYPSYPVWLRTQNPDIEEMAIPNLKIGDVDCLLRSWSRLHQAERSAVASKIMALTSGNTLSVVYGVSAVAQCNDSQSAIAVLTESGLSGNIEEYYASIWKNAQLTIQKGIEISQDPLCMLACAAHLFDGLLDPKVISESFPDVFPQAFRVEECLILLEPLYHCGMDGVYRPLHNDFRLFVSRLASAAAMKPCMGYVAEKLADYVLNADGGLLRSCFGIRVLSAANRVAECLELFDTDFVISAVSQGAPWDLVEEQAAVVFGMACDSHDLLAVQRAESSIATLSQIDEHIKYYEESYPNTRDNYLNTFDVIRVPLDSDHVHSYKTALERIVWLQTVGSDDAGREMFDIWFGPYTPSSFIACLTGQDSRFRDVKNTASELMFLWGRYSVQSGKEYDELNPDYSSAAGFEDQYRSFRDGHVIERLKSVATPNDAQKVLSSLGLSLNVIEDALKDYLCGQDQINGVALSSIASKLVARDPESRSLAVRYVATALSDGAVVEIDRTKERLLHKKERFYFSSETTSWLIAECFLFGYCCDARGFAKACARAESALSWLDQNDYDYPQFMRRARAAVCLGYSACHSLPISKGTPEAQCVERYMTNHSGRSFDFYDADLLLQYMINVGAATCLPDDVLSDRAMESFALSSGAFSTVKLRLVERLAKLSKTTILQRIVEKYYGKDGSTLLSGTNALQVYSLLRDTVKAINPSLARQVDLAIPAMVSGFTDHKDYSLDHLVKLFELGVDRGSAPVSAARRLQGIDIAASKAGDNRMSEDVKRALLLWSLTGGLSELGAIRDRDDEFRYDYLLLWRQFHPLLSFARTADEILACFAVVYGSSSYYDIGDLLQIREAAMKCCDSSDSLGFLDKVEPAIDDVIEGLPEHSRPQLRHGKNEFADSYEKKETAKREAVKTLKDEELPIVAFDELLERWDWTRISAACEEMVSRGEPATDVYERLAERRTLELSRGGWERTSAPCRAVVERISRLASDEVFFKMLGSRKDNLCQYGLGTASTDIAFAIRERIASHPEYDINEFFDIEHESKLRWLTANKAFELQGLEEPEGLESDDHDENTGTDLVTFCTDTLVDLLVENDPHRTEDAIRGLAWLGEKVPPSCDRLFQRFDKLAPRARVLIVKLAGYWLKSGNVEVRDFLESAMVTTESCSELMLLSSILGTLPSSFNIIEPRRDPSSQPCANVLPPRIERFLNDSETLGVNCSDIQREIEQSPNCEVNRMPADGYRRREDVVCPIIPVERRAERTMYREYSKGRWAKLSFPYMAARLIDPSDVWIMSSLPIYEDAESAGVNAIIDALESGRHNGVADSVSALSRIDMEFSKDLLGWKVYVPFGRTEEYELFETTRITRTGFPIQPEITDAALGCYGTAAWNLGLNQSSFDGSHSSLPLCCVTGGCISMSWCDVQIVPAETLYHLGLTPMDNNPLAWVDDSETPVIWFEKMLFLVDRGYNREAYYRQPRMWRWVYDKRVLNEILATHDCSLYRVREELRGDDPMYINYRKEVEESLTLPFDVPTSSNSSL